jgi:uncharacterized protein YcfJ
MLSGALQELAAAGGTALVGAMATDAWATARVGITRLFHHTDSGRQTTIQAQLDGNLALIEHASDPEKARAALSGLWQMELARLLSEHPETEVALAALIAQICNELPAAQRLCVMNNTNDSGTLYAALNGDVIVHQIAPGSPPASSAARGAGAGSTP